MTHKSDEEIVEYLRAISCFPEQLPPDIDLVVRLEEVIQILASRPNCEEVVKAERERIIAGVKDWRRGMSMYCKEVDVLEGAHVQILKVLKALTPTDHLPDRPLNQERD